MGVTFPETPDQSMKVVDDWLVDEVTDQSANEMIDHVAKLKNQSMGEQTSQNVNLLDETVEDLRMAS